MRHTRIAGEHTTKTSCTRPTRAPSRALCYGLLAALFVALPVTANAQEANTATGFETQLFHPIVGPYGVITTEGSRTLEHLRPTAGVMLHYGAEPLIGTREDGTTTALISQQLVSQVQAGIGLTDRFQLDVSMPIYLVNDGFFDGKEITGLAAGDLALRGKVDLFQMRDDLLGVGLRLGVQTPTGKEESLVGAQGVSVDPSLLVDGHIGPVYWATNLGASFHKERQLKLDGREVSFDDRLRYGAGVQWNVFDDVLGVMAETYGSTPLTQLFEPKVSPLEVIVGVKLMTPAGFSVMSGAGGGMISGVGATSFRSFIGLSYVRPVAPEEPEVMPVLDGDDDGFPDDSDACPTEPEDFDEFEDEDGCPDPDNDQDTILDADDQCPLEAGTAALQGCPVVDQDEDGVLDGEDQCVDVAGPAENAGCPWPDEDGDGVRDSEDRCPAQPGVEALQGCPRTVLKSVEVKGDSIAILQKIFFANGKATILEESFPVLDEVAIVLREYPDVLRVEIGGHTDSKGSDRKNKDLSQRRADAVMLYLVEKGGIEPGRLVAVGYGEEEPLVQEVSADDRAKNRRVEFKILERAAPKQADEEVIEDGGEVTGGEEVIEDGGEVTGGEEVIEDGGEVTGGEEVIEDGGTIE